MTIDFRFSPIERDNFYKISAYSKTALIDNVLEYY